MNLREKLVFRIIAKIGVTKSLSVFVPFCLLLALFGTFVCSRIEKLSLKVMPLDLNQNDIRLTVSAKKKN